jgi:hypothetical protein
VRPSGGSPSPTATAATAHTAATTPTAAMAPADMCGAGPLRSGSALHARASTIAIPTYLTAVADALERLGLSMPVGALAVARSAVPALLPELSVACPSCSRSLAAFAPQAPPSTSRRIPSVPARALSQPRRLSSGEGALLLR